MSILETIKENEKEAQRIKESGILDDIDFGSDEDEEESELVKDGEERYYDEDGELVTEYIGTDPDTGMATYKTHKSIFNIS